jgi:hypothetical protein
MPDFWMVFGMEYLFYSSRSLPGTWPVVREFLTSMINFYHFINIYLPQSVYHIAKSFPRHHGTFARRKVIK